MEKIVKKEHSEGKGEAIAGTLTQKKHAEACFCSDPKKLDFYGVEKSTPFLYDKINC